MSTVSYQTGIFYAVVPFDDAAHGAELREAGWRFHWGRSSGKCHFKCLACAKRIDTDRVWYTPDIPKVFRFREMCDDRALEALDKGEQAMAASRATDSNIDVPAPPGLALYGYQRAGVAWLLKRRAALLGDEQGIGKTIQTIGAINADPAIRSVLVVVPATLAINWRRELEKWSVRPTKIVIPKSADDVFAPPAKDDPTVQVLISNYEKLIEGRGKSQVADWDLFRLVMDRRWDLLVVDEAQRLRNPEAAWTKAVFGIPAKGRGPERVPPTSGLVHRADRRWLLSGTPIPNRPVELWPMLSALAPATFHNFLGFAKRYCAAHETSMGAKDSPRRRSWWTFDGATNLAELQMVLRSGTEHNGLMIRRLKEEVLPDLPPKIRHIHLLSPSAEASRAIDAEWSAYRPMQEQIEALRASAVVADLRRDADGYAQAVASLEKSERVAFNQISSERQTLARVKAPLVVDYLKCLLDGGLQKVTVFGLHYVMIDAITEALQEYGVARIDGRVPQAKRMVEYDRYQTDPSCRVFVGNVQAAGVGLNLTASSTIVMSEPSWVPGDNLQAEDRGHRIGSTHECIHIPYLVVDGSLDQRVLEVLVAKMAIQYAALDAREGHTVASFGGASPSEAPVYDAQTRQAALRAVRILDEHKGRSSARRGAGFREQWEKTGRWLARQEELGDQGTTIAIELVRWHRRQLPAELLACLGVEAAFEPPPPKAPTVRAAKKRPGYDFDNLPAVIPRP